MEQGLKQLIKMNGNDDHFMNVINYVIMKEQTSLQIEAKEALKRAGTRIELGMEEIKIGNKTQ